MQLTTMHTVNGREITHALGIVQVPDNPKRIVVLTNEASEALVSLDIIPIGAAQSWRGNPWYDHMAEALKNTQNIGKEMTVNVEQIALLEPDLIIGNLQRHEEIYPLLSAIAPTVLSQRLRADWQKNFLLYGETVGRKQKAEKILAEINQEIADLSKALGPNLSEKISIVRFFTSQARLYQRDSFSGDILNRLGFDRPDNQKENSFVLTLGKESISQMDGDRIFYLVFEEKKDEKTKTSHSYLTHPLWRRLSAVQNGKVHKVDDVIWNTAGGILAARLMLENISEIYGIK